MGLIQTPTLATRAPASLSLSSGYSLHDRLKVIGCDSLRIRDLSTRYPDQLDDIIERLESIKQIIDDAFLLDDHFDALFDIICTRWYLTDERIDARAIPILLKDVEEIEAFLDPKLY